MRDRAWTCERIAAATYGAGSAGRAFLARGGQFLPAALEPSLPTPGMHFQSPFQRLKWCLRWSRTPDLPTRSRPRADCVAQAPLRPGRYSISRCGIEETSYNASQVVTSGRCTWSSVQRRAPVRLARAPVRLATCYPPQQLGLRQSRLTCDSRPTPCREVSYDAFRRAALGCLVHTVGRTCSTQPRSAASAAHSADQAPCLVCQRYMEHTNAVAVCSCQSR